MGCRGPLARQIRWCFYSFAKPSQPLRGSLILSVLHDTRILALELLQRCGHHSHSLPRAKLLLLIRDVKFGVILEVCPVSWRVDRDSWIRTNFPFANQTVRDTCIAALFARRTAQDEPAVQLRCLQAAEVMSNKKAQSSVMVGAEPHTSYLGKLELLPAHSGKPNLSRLRKLGRAHGGASCRSYLSRCHLSAANMPIAVPTKNNEACTPGRVSKMRLGPGQMPLNPHPTPKTALPITNRRSRLKRSGHSNATSSRERSFR